MIRISHPRTALLIHDGLPLPFLTARLTVDRAFDACIERSVRTSPVDDSLWKVVLLVLEDDLLWGFMTLVVATLEAHDQDASLGTLLDAIKELFTAQE